MQHCGKCKRDLRESAFTPAAIRKSSYCRECFNAYRRARGRGTELVQQAGVRRARRSSLSQMKAARGCAECGERDPALLHFHHRDSGEKTMGMAKAVSRAGVDRIDAEIAKCEVLCGPCHRSEHKRLRSEQNMGEWFSSLPHTQSLLSAGR